MGSNVWFTMWPYDRLKTKESVIPALVYHATLHITQERKERRKSEGHDELFHNQRSYFYRFQIFFNVLLFCLLNPMIKFYEFVSPLTSILQIVYLKY